MSLRSFSDQIAAEEDGREQAEAFRRFATSVCAGRALADSNMSALRTGFEEGWKAAREGAWCKTMPLERSSERPHGTMAGDDPLIGSRP